MKFAVINLEKNVSYVRSAVSGKYLHFKTGKKIVTLDGEFSIADLEAVIAKMKKYLPKQDNHE